MCARVGVVPPGASQPGLFFQQHNVVDASLLQLDSHAKTRHACTQDHHLVLGNALTRARQVRVHEGDQPRDGFIGALEHTTVQLEDMPAPLCDLAA